MDIQKDELKSAALSVGISENKVNDLWNALDSLPKRNPSKFDIAHVLYYAGALITLSAMTFFLGISWEVFGGLGIMAIALLYALFFLVVGNNLWNRSLKVPGGLFIFLAVGMTPLIIYGFQDFTHWWVVDAPGRYADFYHWVKGGWFTMEVGTIIAGTIALFYYRFPFITCIIFFCFWFMSMDIAPILYPDHSEDSINSYEWVSLWFGMALIIIGYIIDRKTVADYAFWAYFFGLLSFWCGLTGLVFIEDTSEWTKLLFCLICMGLCFISILLQRHVFLVYGAIGIFVYIGHLSYQYFSDSILFPFVLSFFGVVIIFLGIVFSKNEKKIETTLLNIIPKSLKWLIPKTRI